MRERTLVELTKCVRQLLADNKALREELERTHREREAQSARTKDGDLAGPLLSEKPLPESPKLPELPADQDQGST